MFKKVLIANRGEIACRIICTLKRMGVGSVAVYSEADAGARHVLDADEAVCVGPAPAASSYLDMEKILAAAIQTGAEAIHPGYGFLSENPAFAEACEAAGIAFIGPTPQQMRDFGLKHTARELAEKNGPHTSYPETRAAAGQLQFDLWGVTPSQPERWNKLKERIAKAGVRNSLLIAIAPTATIASIVGCYEAIEPQVSTLFKRETLSGEFMQINRYLVT